MTTDSGQVTTVAGGGLAEIEAKIGGLLLRGYRLSRAIALLVARAKDTHFETVQEWLDWCEERFGYARRTAFQLAKVGKFAKAIGLPVHDGALDGEDEEAVHDRALVPAHLEPLLVCDLHRLEALAELHEQKPDQFEALLRHWNPADCTIRQVSAKVKAFLGAEVHTLTCSDCREEFESERRTQKRCDRCQANYEKKCEKEKERRQENAFERHLTALAELFQRPDDLDPHVERTAPGIAWSAGMVALDLAVTHVSRCGDMARPEIERWLGMVDRLQGVVRDLAAKASD